MANWFTKQNLLWCAIGIGGVLSLIGAFFFIFSFYHPLTLASKIANQDVIAYFEWHHKNDIKADNLTLVPEVRELSSLVDCPLWHCDFWGEENAVVLRERNGTLIKEIYLYRAHKEKLNEQWSKLATPLDGQVDLSNSSYTLTWYDDIAVISTAPLTTVAQVNTVTDMSWFKEASISSWNKSWGTGYCSLTCINLAGTDTFERYQQPLLPAFLQSSIRYLTFATTTNSAQEAEYQLFFTNQYHHPISAKKDYRQVLLAKDDIAGFSGEDLVSKLQMLEITDQNSGLWQTVESLWTNSAAGQAWWSILKNLGNYPYSISLGKTASQARLELTIPSSEQAQWKKNLEEGIKQYAAVLFPKIVAFKLPDGSNGSEYVKNTNLTTSWEHESDSDTLTVSSGEGKKVFKLYVSTDDDQVALSLATPLRISANNLACFRSSAPVEEIAGMHSSELPFILWTTVKQSSSQKIVGDIYFDNVGSSC